MNSFESLLSILCKRPDLGVAVNPEMFPDVKRATEVISGRQPPLVEDADPENFTKLLGELREDYLERRLALLREELSRRQGSRALGFLEEFLRRTRSVLAPDCQDLQNTYNTELPELIDDIRTNRTRGLLTGLSNLDRLVPGGFPFGKVSSIFAESGNYKTTFKNTILWGVAKRGYPVLDLSFEDDSVLTAQRAMSAITGISYSKIATRNITVADAQRIPDAPEWMSRVHLAADINASSSGVLDSITKYATEHGVRLCAIDYIQLVEYTAEGLAKLVRDLQLLSRKLNIAILVVSQVKQDVDFRASKGEDARPRITDMLGSSSLRTGPKVSLGLYRPSRYKTVPKEYKDLHSDIYENLLEVWVRKNIYGGIDRCAQLLVDPTTGAMSEWKNAQAADLI